MRLLAAMKTDVVLQARNQLYAISVGVSAITAGALAWLSPPDRLDGTVPMALLFFVGGSTLLYVVAMILLEKDEGTLRAITVSPLRPWEYLASKVATLTGIATLEGVLIAVGAVLVLSQSAEVRWPSPLLVVGLVALGVMHVLVGIVLVVRYERIMEALIPMGAIATVMQLPAFHFVGAIDHPTLLAIPTGAPAMLIRGSFVALEPWEWGYAIGVSAATLLGLWVWAKRSFEAHVARGVG